MSPTWFVQAFKMPVRAQTFDGPGVWPSQSENLLLLVPCCCTVAWPKQEELVPGQRGITKALLDCPQRKLNETKSQ